MLSILFFRRYLKNKKERYNLYFFYSKVVKWENIVINKEMSLLSLNRSDYACVAICLS